MCDGIPADETLGLDNVFDFFFWEDALELTWRLLRRSLPNGRHPLISGVLQLKKVRVFFDGALPLVDFCPASRRILLTATALRVFILSIEVRAFLEVGDAIWSRLLGKV